MSNFFESFKEKIFSQEEGVTDRNLDLNSQSDALISLGVLLWVVAQSDDRFLPKEEAQIREVLQSYGKVKSDDMPIILEAIKEAACQRIDLYSFAKEVAQGLTFGERVGILENLFRVACADRDLDNEEHEMIRKIAGLLKVDHKGFIGAKIRIKKEFGLDTAGL